MDSFAAAFSFARKGVRHGFLAPLEANSRDTHIRAACAKCGRELRLRRDGQPKRRAKYCSVKCRNAATRERRAAAREDLLQALAQMQAVQQRVERALQILGLRPATVPARKEE